MASLGASHATIIDLSEDFIALKFPGVSRSEKVLSNQTDSHVRNSKIDSFKPVVII